jgi:DNA-binding NarL/FixJ family response regulator
MEKIKILAVGRHEQILETVVRLINNNPEWEGFGALTDKEAVQQFDHQVIDIILLCGGIEPESEINLRAYFTAHRPQVTIVQHYGGGSGLLTAEIYEALKERNKS